MKILIAAKHRYAGGGRYPLEIEKVLKKKGHKVDLIFRIDNLKTRNLFSAILKFRKIASNKKYDVIHSQDWSQALSFFGYKNHVCTYHGLPSNIIASIFHKLVGNRMGERLVSVSPILKRMFKKSKLLYEGVDFKRFKPMKKKKHKGLVVGFAQPFNSSNFEIIKKAVDMIPNAKLLVAKKVPFDKMCEFYNKLDVFISLPFKYAGFNLVWLESMACNIPTIGCNYGIGEKLSIDKVTPPFTIEKVKHAILNAKKRDYRTWLKKNGFSWEKHVNGLLKMYKQVAQ